MQHHVHVDVQVHKYTRTHTHTQIRMHIYKYTYAQTDTYTCTHTHSHTDTYIYIHIYIYIHVLYTHRYVCMLTCLTLVSSPKHFRLPGFDVQASGFEVSGLGAHKPHSSLELKAYSYLEAP